MPGQRAGYLQTQPELEKGTKWGPLSWQVQCLQTGVATKYFIGKTVKSLAQIMGHG